MSETNALYSFMNPLGRPLPHTIMLELITDGGLPGHYTLVQRINGVAALLRCRRSDRACLRALIERDNSW